MRSPPVAVWSATVSTAPPTARLLAALSDDERQRAERFGRDADRDRFVVGRAGLRQILGRRLGRTPRSLAFSYGAWGKPVLAAPTAPPFSVSHSGDVVIWSVSAQRAVGVDIEAVPSGDVDPDLRKLALSAREGHLLAALPENERTEWFYTGWVFKEACAKALGLGLALPPDQIDVVPSLLGGARTVRVDGLPHPVSVALLNAPLGYRAALALVGPRRTAPPPVRPWDWSEG